MAGRCQWLFLKQGNGCSGYFLLGCGLFPVPFDFFLSPYSARKMAFPMGACSSFEKTALPPDFSGVSLLPYEDTVIARSTITHKRALV